MSDYNPIEAIGPDRAGPALVLCDHASNLVPPSVNGGDLGISAEDMNRHIAYDVGAAGVARLLAEHLSAPALLTRYSRLVIDPNRGPDDPTLLMKLYDGSIIPANRRADAAEIALRRGAFYDPYHDAITAQIDAMIGRGTTPHLISIHSFTHQFRGRDPRPWHAGVLWDRDDRLSAPLIAALESEGDLAVGNNQPYSGQLQGDCLNRHGTNRNLPHVLIEIRNDLISEESGQTAWAVRLARLLAPLIPVKEG